MKTFIISLMVLLGQVGYSQITLDFQSSNSNLVHIRLSNTETKYFENDWLKIDSLNQFSLYNIDGSFYKTIQMPLKPDPSANIEHFNYVSTSLFDNDPSSIEYLICYSWLISGIGHHQVKIMREDGTVLLNEIDALPYYLYPDPIYSTEEGTKLLLLYQDGNGVFYQVKVFNLPGEIPTSVEEKTNTTNNDLTLYPNPNNGSFFIKFIGKEGDANIIDLYSGNGKLIETYKSNNSQININKNGLPEGLYLLNNRGGKLNSTTKMIIKK